MSAAAHITAALFTIPAGLLSYAILIVPDHPQLDIRHLAAVVLLFIIPVVGLPEIAGVTVLYYGGGFLLAARLQRHWHRRRTKPSAALDRHHSEADAKGRPIIFKTQRRDD